MIQAHIDNKKSVPLWAIVGAPLIGVPLMVALLALTTPAGVPEATDIEAGIEIEQVDVQSVEQTIDVDIEEAAVLRRS
ncbi:MAG: hypothetical protein O2958_12860 [Gemmatimonadetes bacterium]|nr:hypothetical protein [Gemmatimonadota bacterium]MDA1103694.1 hypothetical protein [Gemmatimonadota bacterium]